MGTWQFIRIRDREGGSGVGTNPCQISYCALQQLNPTPLNKPSQTLAASFLDCDLADQSLKVHETRI
jgi:hypothetical protein